MTRSFGILWLAALAACGGGGDPPAGNPGPLLNRYTGTVTVTSALPAGTTSCVGPTQTVTFSAAGVSTFQVSVPGGGCVTFANGDTAQHQPATRNPNPCPALNAPAALATSQAFTTAPLGGAAGPQTCDWQDALNQPTPGGGY